MSNAPAPIQKQKQKSKSTEQPHHDVKATKFASIAYQKTTNEPIPLVNRQLTTIIFSDSEGEVAFMAMAVQLEEQEQRTLQRKAKESGQALQHNMLGHCDHCIRYNSAQRNDG